MTDASIHPTRARFDTRTEADRAVEHLVQQAGIERARIQILPEGQRNSAGTEASGGDLGPVRRDDPPLAASLIVEVSDAGDQDAIAAALTDTGGIMIA